MKSYHISILVVLLTTGGVWAQTPTSQPADSADLLDVSVSKRSPEIKKPPSLLAMGQNYFFNQDEPYQFASLPDPIFGKGPVATMLKDWYSLEHDLAEKGLLFNISYTFWNQWAAHTRNDPKFDSPQGMSTGRLDFGLRWNLPKTPIGWGHVEVLMRQGTNMGYSYQTQLNNNVGSLNGICAGYSPSISLNVLSYTHHLFDERLKVTVGKLHPNQYLSLSPIANDESTQFIAGCFDGNNIPFLGTYAPGMAIQIEPFENRDIYVHMLGLDMADGPTTGFGGVGDGKYAGALEFGWTPTFGEKKLRGHYKLTGWYADLNTSHYQRRGSGFGFAFYADQEIVHHLSLFVQYGYGNPSATFQEHFLSGGMGIFEPFDRHGEMFGMAMAWSRSSLTGHDEQLMETFYRFQLTDAIQFTPDLQVVFNPNLDPDRDVNVILGARFRIQF